MKNIEKSTLSVFFVAVFATFFSFSAMAVEVAQVSDATEIEIDRGEAELRDTLRPHPDNDVIDTALVFTNGLETPTSVHCVAFSENGQALGRAWVRIPGRGLRFMRASDLANGRDFIGSAKCKARGKVIPTAFIVGLGLTDTKAKATIDWTGTQMIFPAVVTY